MLVFFDILYLLYVNAFSGAFTQVEAKHGRQGRLAKSKLKKVFKKLEMRVDEDELDRALFLIGGILAKT